MVGDFAAESGEKPLLDYQQDGSNKYTLNKGVALFIGHYNSKRTITFKPFLESYSLDITYDDQEDIYKNQDGVMKQIKVKKGIKYNLSLVLPSNSINEGNLNLAKVEEFRRLVHSNVNPGNFQAADREFKSLNQFGLLLSNIISNGMYRSKKDISSWSRLEKYAVFGYIDDLTIDHLTEYGYYDGLVKSKDKLTPKALKITFSLNVNIGTTNDRIGKYLYLPFKKDGKYNEKDTKYWPFGVATYGYLGSDGRQIYADNRNAYFSIISKKVGDEDGSLKRRVEFELSADSLTFKSTVNRGKASSISGDIFQDIYRMPEHNQSVDLSLKMFANSLNEAKANMKRIQYLVRLVNLNPEMVEEVKGSSAETLSSKERSSLWQEIRRQGGSRWQGLWAGSKLQFYKNKGFIEQGGSNISWEDYQTLYASALNSSDPDIRKEAKTNHGFIINFLIAVAKDKKLNKGTITFSTKQQYSSNLVLISNLENAGRNTTPSYNNVYNNGHKVIFKNINFSPILDLGFFEQDGMLYFKGYDISFSYEFATGEPALAATYGYTANNNEYSEGANDSKVMGALDYDDIIKIT